MSPHRLAIAILAVALLCPSAHSQTPAPKVLADFEDGTGGAFDVAGGTIAPTKNLDGKSVTLKVNQRLSSNRLRIDPAAFNLVKFDTFNASAEPLRLHVMFRDDSAPHGYYSWINRYVSVKPGRSAVELYIPELKRGEGSPKDMLDPRPFHWDKLAAVGITPLAGEVEIDNIRLERIDIAPPAGVLAFDFGPADSPVFPGMTGVSPDTSWTDAAGFGWTKKSGLSARRRVGAPDSFVGDWINGNGAVFSVKVPNGKVHAWMIWEDPGEWEFYQNFTSRRILANGKAVLSETENGEQFLDRYFHFAEFEDFPGEDIHKKYIGWRYPAHTFDVDVTDGRLDLTIEGSGQYAATVNGIVVYPDAKRAEGEAFIKSLGDRRREAFYKTWSEKLPAKPAAAAGPAVVVSRVDLDRDVQVYDLPDPASVLKPGEGFERTAARGECAAFSFAVHAQAGLDPLRLSVGDLKSDDGKTLPAGALDVRVVRYKFKRIGFGGSGVYGVVPWILVDGSATSVPANATRRAWVTVRVPKDQPAGTYRGEVKAAGAATFSVPVTVRVLPLELPDADVGISMFSVGETAPYWAYFPESQARLDADRERSFAFAREHGFTSARIAGVRFLSFKDGKAQFDFSGAKKQADLVKRLGFPYVQLIIDGGGIWRQTAEDKGVMAQATGFASNDDMVKELFGAAIREAKAAGLGEPAWTFADEPPDTVAPGLVALHKRLRDLADAKSYVCWSPGGEPTQQLLDVTGLANLNNATIEHIKRAQAAGNTVELNNQGSSRWAFGLYLWKAHQAGVSNTLQFTWIGTHGDPYYPLDSYEDDLGHVFPDRAGNLRPTADLERVRQGINDYRYVLALTRAVAAKKSPVSAEADAWLKAAFDKVKFENTGRDRHPQMTEAELDAFRAKVQDYLVKLAQ